MPRCARTRRPGLPLLLRLALASATAVTAADACAGAGWTVIQIDNDAIALGPKTDRWYTGGARLMTLSEGTPGEDGGPPALAARLLWRVDRAAPLIGGPTLTQLVYTPDDIGDAGPPPADRPAGAWLAAGLFAQRTTGRLTEAAELKIGPTGPAALGRPVQDGIHRALGLPLTASWDRQTRPMVGLEYGWTLQARLFGAPGPLALAPHAALTVGTVRRDLSIGLMLLAGRPPAGLPADGQEGRTVPVAEPQAAGMPAPLPGGLHAYADLRLRRVGWQAFIDGEVFGEPPGVRHRRWMREASLGLALPLAALPGRPTLALTASLRSQEFDADPAPRWPRQRIGTITLVFVR